MWRQVQEQTRELKQTRTEVIRQLGRAAELGTMRPVSRDSHEPVLSGNRSGIWFERPQADLLQNVAPCTI